MTLFGVRHTLRWATYNAAEFDRLHLHSLGAWLFGRRPVRQQRPPRRIGILAVAGLWAAFVISSDSSPHTASAVAGILQVVILVMVAAGAFGFLCGVAVGLVKRWRRRA
jgi:hypothetical protein